MKTDSGEKTAESPAVEKADDSPSTTRDSTTSHDEPESGREPDDGPDSGGKSKPDPDSDAEKPRAEMRRRWPRISDPVSAVAIVLVVIAAGCAGWFGWSWYSAAHDDSLNFSRTRDAVLRAGEQGVQNMNTLDYRTVDRDLNNWENSSTGDLRQQLAQGRARFREQVQQAKTVTTAKILDGAITELDARAGRARMIVALQITVTPPEGKPTTKQSRMVAELTRTSSGWKLSALGQAPVGTTVGGD